MILSRYGYFLYPKLHNILRVWKDENGYSVIFHDLSKDNKIMLKKKGYILKLNLSKEEMERQLEIIKTYPICEYVPGVWQDKET